MGEDIPGHVVHHLPHLIDGDVLGELIGHILDGRIVGAATLLVFPAAVTRAARGAGLVSTTTTVVVFDPVAVAVATIVGFHLTGGVAVRLRAGNRYDLGTQKAPEVGKEN